MTPLLVRSHYSLMRGTAPVDRLCEAARRLGYQRLALTDTDNLHGLWPFLRACRRHGLRPLVGAEVTDPGGSGRRAVCLARDDRGFRNLCQLLSARHLDPGFGLQRGLPPRAAGLLVLTDNEGLLRSWQADGLELAAALPLRHGVAPLALRRAARRLGLPAVAVPDATLLDPGDLELHRVLRAIAGRTSLSRLAPQQVAPPGAHLASPEEYRRRFAADPEALAASDELARRCAFRGPDQTAVLPPWRDARGRPATEVLREAAHAGARRRYGPDLGQAVVERLEHELRQIRTMGFSAYFLVVQQIVRQSPRICGRGSAAASLVAYCLEITNVCPLKHNLYFERFLNPGRSDPPDIDVDFAWDERDAVLAWVLQKHQGHAAMVCNHVLFQPRMAIRETARVFGLAEREISRVTATLPHYWRQQPAAADLEARVRAPAEVLRTDLSEPWPSILRLAAALVGTPRHLAVHVGGVVITPRPVADYAPLQHAAKAIGGARVPVLQWEKEGTEQAGLVKIDLLGNRSLGVIRDALASLAEQGRPLDELRWEPEDDPRTQRAVARGQTMGCFYIESPAMRLLQQKTGRGDFEHLVIHSSIIRPAANAYIREYVRRLRGGAWEPLHPLLAEVLQETHGIMVYQEHISLAAVALAGFSHAEADGLRKLIGKQGRERELAAARACLERGARARGVSRACVEQVWQMMLSFSGYSFCKPHSASFARVSFQAAYLKVHHPAEFSAAVISNGGGFYSTFAYVSEARRLGLNILPPDVNCSRVKWTGQRGALRVGLMSLKALGQRCREQIVAGRRRRPFRSLDDLLSRVRPEEQEARALINAGACDSLAPGGQRADLLWRLLDWQGKGSRSAGRGQTGDLFREAAMPAPRLPPGDELERLRLQFSTLGFLCDRHPMLLFAGALAGQGTVKARDLARHVGRRVRTAGWLIAGKVVPTRSGEAMEFLTFEDETAVMETTFFPEAYRRFCHVLDYSRPYLLDGLVEQDYGAVTLTVERARPLSLTRCPS